MDKLKKLENKFNKANAINDKAQDALEKSRKAFVKAHLDYYNFAKEGTEIGKVDKLEKLGNKLIKARETCFKDLATLEKSRKAFVKALFDYHNCYQEKEELMGMGLFTCRH